MDYNITSIVDSWSVRCMKEGTNVASTFVIDESGLSFITSDNLNGFIVNEGAIPNLLKGVWEFEASPIVPEAKDNNSPTPLRQVVQLIDDSERGMTLQKAYDNYDTEPDGQLNGFSGTTPTEFRVGNSVLKLNQGNLTISLRDELNDYVTTGIDLTDGVLSLYGNVRVPDTIETSHPNSAVNLTKLFYELESLLMSDNTWTKNNVFKNGLQSEKEPEFDADVANKKYVDTKLLSALQSSIIPVKMDLDTFEGQAHTWSAENVFTGPVKVTEPANDDNPTTKGYVDRIESELSKAIERVEQEAEGRDELTNEAFNALKDDVDTFETQDHSWSGANMFNGKTQVNLDPSDGVDVANKKYVDSVAATRSPWQGSLNLSASDTTTLPIYTDVYKSYQWRIGTGSIVVNGVTYANGDLVIANEDIKGTDAKPVSKFSFFNGQDADVVKTTENQTVSNKTVTNTDLSANDNVYREATPTQDGTVVLAETVESGNGGVVTSGLLADQGYVDVATEQEIDEVKAFEKGLLVGSFTSVISMGGGSGTTVYHGYHLKPSDVETNSSLTPIFGPLRIDRYSGSMAGTRVVGSLIFPNVVGEETIATVKNISDIFGSDNTWTGVQTIVGDLHINVPEDVPEADLPIPPAIVLNSDSDSFRLTLPGGKDGTFALKEDVVSLSGAETITGEKDFTVSPSVPTAELDTNDNTAASTAFVKGCIDIVDSKKASLLYTDPKAADNNASAYGTTGTLKAYGAFGDAISVESITVTRGTGNAENVNVDLWCRLLKSTGTSWVVVAQSVGSRRWSEVSENGDLEFKMATVSHDLPSESDKIAVVFVNSASAEAHSSNGPLRFRTTSGYRGSLNNAITTDPSVSTGAAYSPRVKFGFISMAKGASVHIEGAETITGNKTFSGSTTLNGSVTINQNATVKGLNIANKTFISNIIDAGELKVTHHGQDNGFILRTKPQSGTLHKVELLSTNGSSSWTYTFPNKSGTVALAEDLPNLQGLFSGHDGSNINVGSARTFVTSPVDGGYFSGFQLTDFASRLFAVSPDSSMNGFMAMSADGEVTNRVFGGPLQLAVEAVQDDEAVTLGQVNELVSGFANDSEVVHLDGSETITGRKTFKTGTSTENTGGGLLVGRIAEDGTEGIWALDGAGLHLEARRGTGWVTTVGLNLVSSESIYGRYLTGSFIRGLSVMAGGTTGGPISVPFLPADTPVGQETLALKSDITAADANVVHKTGDETIAGNKTFTSAVSTPSVQFSSVLVSFDKDESSGGTVLSFSGTDTNQKYNFPDANGTPQTVLTTTTGLTGEYFPDAVYPHFDPDATINLSGKSVMMEDLYLTGIVSNGDDAEASMFTYAFPPQSGTVALDEEVVHKSGDEEIDGVKHFSAIKLGPTGSTPNGLYLSGLASGLDTRPTLIVGSNQIVIDSSGTFISAESIRDSVYLKSEVYSKSEIDGVDTGADTVIKMNEIYGYLNDYETFAGEELPLELYSEVVAEFQRWQENPKEEKLWVTRDVDGQAVSTNPYYGLQPDKPIVDFSVVSAYGESSYNYSSFGNIITDAIIFLPNAKKCESMFRGTNFSGLVICPFAENCYRMFQFDEKFNSPLSLPKATNCQALLNGASIFNQPLSLPKAQYCTHMLNIATLFNQPLDLPEATLCSYMLYRATAFNQPLSLPKATNCSYMLQEAASFNQPLSLPKCSGAQSAFADTAMSAENISATLDSLPTWTSGSHVITFTGSPGASELTQDSTSVANAVAKGWTVEL